MALSKEEWELVARRLSGTFGSVTMIIDGFKVGFYRGQVAKNQLGIMVFVNDIFKAEWLLVGSEEARRFYRRRIVPLYTGKRRATIKKLFGKAESLKTHSYYTPIWPSAKLLRGHLLRNNQSIVLVSPLLDASSKEPSKALEAPSSTSSI